MDSHLPSEPRAFLLSPALSANARFTIDKKEEQKEKKTSSLFLLFRSRAGPRSEMELTAQQLRGFDGSDASKPIYVAIRGAIYDVSSGKGFYGPGGPYAVFAGREASRALAKMSKSEDDVCGDLDGLSDKELGVLADWENKFQAKYPVVGHLAS